MNKPRDLSFKPGPGETSPVLAGCKEEIKLILDRLKNGNSLGQNIFLVGPRGNGKTVLLQWVKEEVDLYKGEVKCAVLDSDCFRTHDDLVGSLAHDDLVGSHENLGGFKVERLKAKPPFIEVEASRHGAKKEMLRDVLEQRCSENGLAILIDEAHTLCKHPDEVRKFFSTCKRLQVPVVHCC